MITREQKQSAKERALVVWEYLANHPEIKVKYQLPEELFNLIHFDVAYCPLCTLFLDDSDWICPGCPLDRADNNCRSLSKNDWMIWSNNEYAKFGEYSNEERLEAAERILTIIEQWDVDADE
jgi:hypothetical protein